MRGAGYTAFDGTLPDQPQHSAVGAAYAHATAPLRRLADRYVGELCVAVCAGQPVPDWVRARLPTLPDIMAESGRRAHALEHACIDLVECALLSSHVGETFSADVVARNHRGGTVQLRVPPVIAHCEGADLSLGERIVVRLDTADVATGKVLFSRA